MRRFHSRGLMIQVVLQEKGTSLNDQLNGTIISAF